MRVLCGRDTRDLHTGAGGSQRETGRWLMQWVWRRVRYTAMRFRGGAASRATGASASRAGPMPQRLHAAGSVCVRSGMWQRQPWDLSLCAGCVRRVRGAGGQRGSCARGGCYGGARRARALCCREAVPWIRTPPRPQRLWANSLLVPATQHGTGSGVQFVKESGAGFAGAGC